MIYVHIYLDDVRRGPILMEHLPRVGDTLRFSEMEYARVTEVVWCLDEPINNGQRINIRSESEQPT